MMDKLTQEVLSGNEDLRAIHEKIDKVEDWDMLPITPMVTICISTYNQEKYIRQTLDGVLMQKVNFPYEIIIKEDFSTDTTREIVLDYHKKHPDKIRLWLCKENLFSQKLKPRIDLFSRGKYTARCEGDDFWIDPLKMQKQVDFLEENVSYSGVYTNFKISDINGNILKERAYDKSQPPFYDKISILKDGLPMTLTGMYRNYKDGDDSFKTLPNYKVVNGDQVIAAFMAQRGRIGYLTDVTAVRRLGSGSFSTKTKERQALDRINTFKLLKEWFVDAQSQDALTYRIHGLYLEMTCNYLLRGNFKKALETNSIRKGYCQNDTPTLFTGLYLHLKAGITYRCSILSNRVKKKIKD